MFDDTYTPKIFQVRELNSSLFSPSQFVKATGRAYILDNVQSLIQTSRPLTIDVDPAPDGLDPPSDVPGRH